MGVFHIDWESMAQPACNHTFQGIEHFNRWLTTKNRHQTSHKKNKTVGKQKEKGLGTTDKPYLLLFLLTHSSSVNACTTGKKCISFPCS